MRELLHFHVRAMEHPLFPNGKRIKNWKRDITVKNNRQNL